MTRRRLTLPAWLAALDRLLLDAEALAESNDERARDLAQLARFMREQRPKGM